MAILLKSTSLSYKDVNLIAQPGKIQSRSEIPIEGWRIVISAMSSIIGPTFIKAVHNLISDFRPTIHIPRDVFQIDNLKAAEKYKLQDNCLVGVNLNVTRPEEIKTCMNWGFKNFFIDIANGYLPQIKYKVQQLHELGAEEIVCGSVHTIEGYNILADFGVTIVRSGIATGNVCITSQSTGFTRGALSEVLELDNARQVRNGDAPLILADGGFKVPGDYVKAFLGGADYVMGGRMFIDCEECRMHSEGYEDLDIPMGVYFGMASKYGKMCMDKNIIYVEGNEFEKINSNITLSKRIMTIWEGIRSGISYSGYKTLSDAIGNGIFEIIA